MVCFLNIQVFDLPHCEVICGKEEGNSNRKVVFLCETVHTVSNLNPVQGGAAMPYDNPLEDVHVRTDVLINNLL